MRRTIMVATTTSVQFATAKINELIYEKPIHTSATKYAGSASSKLPLREGLSSISRAANRMALGGQNVDMLLGGKPNILPIRVVTITAASVAATSKVEIFCDFRSN